jgi:hypothetical protein
MSLPRTDSSDEGELSFHGCGGHRLDSPVKDKMSQTFRRGMSICHFWESKYFKVSLSFFSYDNFSEKQYFSSLVLMFLCIRNEFLFKKVKSQK